MRCRHPPRPGLPHSVSSCQDRFLPRTPSLFPLVRIGDAASWAGTRNPVTCRNRRGIQRVIIGYIVKGAFDAWTATGDDCRQTRKRIGRFRGRSIAVVKAPTSNLRIRPPCFVVEAFIVEHALLSVMLITVAGYS